MRYPKVWRSIINGTAWFAGGLAFVVAILQVMEACMRYFFGSPTSWSLTISQYCLCFALFIGSSYAFQEHGHVAVDMIRDLADKHDKTGKRITRRGLAIFGYVGCVIYVLTLFRGILILLERGIRNNTTTGMVPDVPIWMLYFPMMLGIVFMVLTLIFMILDILAGGEQYL